MKLFQHEEFNAIQAAVREYREEPDTDAAAGALLADRIELALRGSDWRRMEASK